MKDRHAKQEPLETVISIRFDQNLPQGEIDYKIVDTGESYRVVEAQSENKTEEKR
jgi:hypothetical protein